MAVLESASVLEYELLEGVNHVLHILFPLRPFLSEPAIPRLAVTASQPWCGAEGRAALSRERMSRTIEQLVSGTSGRNARRMSLQGPRKDVE